MAAATYDVLSMGRSSIDLYSNDVGAAFVDITSFAAYVGGCPTNISVGTRRLGLRPALLTAVGEDVVGDFILHFLEQEGVETAFIPRKPGRRTSAVVLGIEPPDKFPLVYYRDNCADIALSIDDVLAAPLAASRALLISGTGLSAATIRSVLPYVNIVIGTDDEINAAMLTDPAQISVTHSQVSDTRVTGDVDSAIRGLLAIGP